jgi:tRNA threonylcarbamoyladenosine biosynthesis protein TsaE
MEKRKPLEWRNCSEEELLLRIRESSAGWFTPDTIVFLEGEMGAGKSTFVRQLLSVLSPSALSLGSPTFPLVQTYRSGSGMPIYHMDLYRLKTVAELTDSGIEEQIEEGGALVLIEWGSLFQEELEVYRKYPERIGKRSILIEIGTGSPEGRDYLISF